MLYGAYGPYFPREASPSRGGAEGPVANSSMIRVPIQGRCCHSIRHLGRRHRHTDHTDAVSAEATVSLC